MNADVPDHGGTPRGSGVGWGLRPRWVLGFVSAHVLGAGVVGGALAAVGKFDPFVLTYVAVHMVWTVAVAWRRRIRLTEDGLEYVNSVTRIAVRWQDVEAVDRRHVTFRSAQETMADTGLKLSTDSLVGSLPRRQRRIPLDPFVDGEALPGPPDPP